MWHVVMCVCVFRHASVSPVRARYHSTTSSTPMLTSNLIYRTPTGRKACPCGYCFKAPCWFASVLALPLGQVLTTLAFGEKETGKSLDAGHTTQSAYPSL